MPIYEYQCPKCGKFDVIQKMSEKPLKTHDVCGSKVQKLLSTSSFAFKGSGFYITDYKKGNGSSATPEKTDKSGKSDKKGKEATSEKPKTEPAGSDKPKGKDCASCPSNGKAA